MYLFLKNTTFVAYTLSIMKKIFLLISMMVGITLTVHAQLGVFINDYDGPFTNIRNAPKGAIVDKIPTSDAVALSVVRQVNGWWLIDGNEYWSAEKDDVTLHGSKSGYWIHSSVLGMGTRNYGGQKLTLRKDPSSKAAVTYSFTKELTLVSLDIKGEWVKVKTTDSKHTGWIKKEWLCGNPVTNCC